MEMHQWGIGECKLGPSKGRPCEEAAAGAVA